MKSINTLYIIDDDPIFVFTTKKMFDKEKICQNILVFPNGEDAINHLTPLMDANNEKELPELILLDLNMPIMDGWQFLDEFVKHKTEKKIIIFIVSSSIDPNDIQKANEYQNVSNYIIKPITREKIKHIASEITALVN